MWRWLHFCVFAMGTYVRDIIGNAEPTTVQSGPTPWTLPTFPSTQQSHPLPHPSYYIDYSTNATSSSSGKLIPRYIWIAVKNATDVLNYQIPELFKRNLLWNAYVAGNAEKDRFMNEQFNGTSLLWAYNMISPWAGAAKADIWRYSSLLFSLIFRLQLLLCLQESLCIVVLCALSNDYQLM